MPSLDPQTFAAREVFMNAMTKKIFFAVFLFCAALPMKGRAEEAYMVFTSPGEDPARQMHISWHSDIADTYVEFTRKSDPEYNDAVVVSGSAVSSVFDDSTFGSYAFYRCHVLLDGLQRDTKYIFRIRGDSITQDYSFKTADGFDDFSFIFMSDVHAYPPIPSRVARAEALVSEAMDMRSDLDFILFTGDITAHGANYTHWENISEGFFTREFMLAATPGNHDYYNSAAETIDDRFFNAIFMNPDNGAEEALNTTYWFRYNGAVFISLNTEARSQAQIDSQKAWLREVVENIPAQYYIAYAHRAFFLGHTTIQGGGIVRKSSDSYPTFGNLLEELEVDLVLAGHNHVYVRTKPIYGGEVAAEGEGTVYITANQIGDRGRMAASDLGEYGEAIYGGTTESNSISTISVIDITATAIYGEMFDANGAVFDTYTIPARRDPIVDDFDRDAYLDSFSAHVNTEDLTLGILRFSGDGFDRVDNIQVLDADAANVTYASFSPVEGMTQTFFSPLTPGITYSLVAAVTFRDSQQGERHLTLVNKLYPGTVENLRIQESEETEVFLRWDNHLVPEEIEDIRIAVNHDPVHSLDAQQVSLDITSGLVEGNNAINFTVTDKYGDLIFEENLQYAYIPSGETAKMSGGCGGCSVSRASGSSNHTHGQRAILLFLAFLLFLILRIEGRS